MQFFQQLQEAEQKRKSSFRNSYKYNNIVDVVPYNGTSMSEARLN